MEGRVFSILALAAIRRLIRGRISRLLPRSAAPIRGRQLPPAAGTEFGKFRIYLSAVAAPIFGTCPNCRCVRFFGIPFGQSFPLRRFTHCGTADRRATNVPRRILQTMFRSVTIFMRATVSGNSLLLNRFSDRAHNFSNAHRERITAAASFFFF